MFVRSIAASVALALIALGWTLAAGARGGTDGAALKREVEATFAAHRAVAPQWDDGLAKLAVAWTKAPATTDARVFLRNRGVADGLVVPVAASGAAESRHVRGQLLSYVARSVIPQRVTHFGVAESGSRALLVFVRRTLEGMSWPAPRSGQRAARLTGRLSESGYSRVMLAVGRPDGRVDRVRVSRKGQRLWARVPFLGGDGRYVVEIVAKGARGLEVLALRTVHVGVPSLVTVPVPRPIDGADEATLEARLLSLINRERGRHELAVLALDPALTRTARGHAAAMAAAGVAAHKLPGGSSAKARLKRAGVHTRRFFENVAMAATVDQAHRELWESPSHRLALIDPTVQRVGIGVVRRQSEGGQALFIVEHLAAR